MVDKVIQACEACYDAHIGDCSGFARAVADRVGIVLEGNADAIADLLEAESGGWTKLAGGPAAAAAAGSGKLVLGALRGDRQEVPDAHGHVVVVVAGPLNRGLYPTAYWGSLAGNPGKDKTINWAWTEADREKVVYAAIALPG